MTDQRTHYELYCYDGLGFCKMTDFTFIEDARAYAEGRKSREEEFYKIVSVTVSTFDIPTFSVPAYVPTLEEIAQEIIDGSDGSFHVEWGEDFEQLEEPARSQVEAMVWEEISNCDCCGWHFHVDHLEQINGEMVCWKCEDDVRAEEEDEEDED